MSDPLLDLEEEETSERDRGPLQVGDSVVWKGFEQFDFCLVVKQIYWTGSKETGYWMVDVQFGDNWKAHLYAPIDRFLLKPKQENV